MTSTIQLWGYPYGNPTPQAAAPCHASLAQLFALAAGPRGLRAPSVVAGWPAMEVSPTQPGIWMDMPDLTTDLFLDFWWFICMGAYWFLRIPHVIRICMNFYGFPWIGKGFYRFPWISMWISIFSIGQARQDFIPQPKKYKFGTYGKKVKEGMGRRLINRNNIAWYVYKTFKTL